MLGFISTIGPDHIAIFIPILISAGGIFIAVVAIIFNARKKELEHKERLIAIEKGIPIPEQTNEKRPTYSSRRASGLTLLGIGLALTVALWVVNGARGGVWGLIPLFMGTGMLIASYYDKKEYEREKGLEHGSMHSGTLKES